MSECSCIPPHRARPGHEQGLPGPLRNARDEDRLGTDKQASGVGFLAPQQENGASQKEFGKLHKEPKQTSSTNYCHSLRPPPTPNNNKKHTNTEPDILQGMSRHLKSSSLQSSPLSFPRCLSAPQYPHSGDGPGSENPHRLVQQKTDLWRMLATGTWVAVGW